MITEDEFTEWKQWPVTKAFFLLLKRRRELIKEHLAMVAGENALDDRLQAGKAQELDDVCFISYDDLKEIE